ncbi:proline--tRNA ligase [Candidatus Roizmanbacteria bacterium CG10_big_fil_rev_8_21_14_0_10_39_6]|uniref:Proline--tRNA ligase n=1 Tax=Candidatus Roizmanbacteria bacterium CG10_big_fil_rev_8_21_14_0_10_39_6 TaxID=1974853 RepID=A0A2M8KSG8_9BACT|nr:MAG: proline--tRNA ligase [Candidatus Roizmanbacteria bacterium CG10_big_fil_rev_8_21_14_0_10_39_6]
MRAIQQARLADYSPVKGCMVIRPNGYGIWENIQKNLDPMLNKLGLENAYFPLFIPLSLLNKEAKHVEGFSPELAVVTHGGGEVLEEKLAVRPTSETIMYAMYSKWVESYRDLPLLLNQWNNVVRWEKRTYFFLRTTEFLWQEAHTAHTTHNDALKMVFDGLETYRDFIENYLAIPVIKGRKSNSEKFAGADLTTTVEAIMPDGKALQAGTSHDLRQNFSKKEAFNIAFQNEAGETSYAWQTSFGLSTRTIGALVMTHGDDEGLIIPPRVAKFQVAIVPTEIDEKVIMACQNLQSSLNTDGVRTKLFADTEHRYGWKLNEAEIQGIPLTIVIGKKELEAEKITAKIRHSHTEESLSGGNISAGVKSLLDNIQDELYKKAIRNREMLTTTVENYEELKEVMATKRGFVRAFWCEDEDCEKLIKEETKATTRCLPFIDNEGNVLEEHGVCVKCGKRASHRWLFAQAY